MLEPRRATHCYCVLRIAYLLSFGIPFATWLGLSLRLFAAVAADTSHTLVERSAVTVCCVIFAIVGYRFRQAVPAFTLCCPFLAFLQSLGIVSLPVLAAGFCAVVIGRCAAKQPFTSRNPTSPTLFVWNTLAVCLVLSLGATMLHGSFPWQSLWATTPIFHGFADQRFPITNSHLWLSGWLLVTLLIKVDNGRNRIEPHLPDLHVTVWIGGTGVSYLVQKSTGLPTLFDGFLAFAPFEDIHAYGSALTALLLFCASKAQLNYHRRAWLLAAIALGGLLAFSFSRGAWLGTLIGLGLLASLRLPRWSSISLAAATCAIFLALFFSAPKFELINPHLSRLAQFVRVDRWTQTESARFDLYRRALRMIEAQPLFGHGLGSSYMRSGQFAGSEEPAYFSSEPHFLHNSLLQLAAEAGLPAVFSFLFVLGIVLLQAIRAVSFQNEASRETCALITACVGYLGTQLTANAINIYSTQIYFFWPLFAMLWVSTTQRPRQVNQAFLSTMLSLPRQRPQP